MRYKVGREEVVEEYWLRLGSCVGWIIFFIFMGFVYVGYGKKKIV